MSMRLAIVLVALSGAATTTLHAGQATPQPTTKTIAERLEFAEAQITWFQAWLSDVGTRTAPNDGQLDCSEGKVQEIAENPAYLVFLVRCEKIEPYLEGYRLTITIGNPYRFDFTGIRGELGYGDSLDKAIDQTIKFDNTAVAKAGTWTTLFVIVNPVAAKDVRFIRISKLAFGTTRPGQ